MHVKLGNGKLLPPADEVDPSKSPVSINNHTNGTLPDTESSSDISIDGDANAEMIKSNGKR